MYKNELGYIIIEKPEDFDNSIPKRSKIVFKCKQCNRLVAMSYFHSSSRKGRLKSMLCRKCYTVQYWINKYGVSNPCKLDEVKQKARLTKIKRYGDPNYHNWKKARQTMNERYGDRNSVE